MVRRKACCLPKVASVRGTAGSPVLNGFFPFVPFKPYLGTPSAPVYSEIPAAMYMDLCHKAICPLHPLMLASRTAEHASTRAGSILLGEDRLRDTGREREEGRNIVR